MSPFEVNEEGYFGRYGGAYIPEILQPCVKALRDNYRAIIDSEDFRREYDALLRDYVGRPSPLYRSEALSALHGCTVYLKREDLNHTGAHKINNAIGQILLARPYFNTQPEGLAWPPNKITSPVAPRGDSGSRRGRRGIAAGHLSQCALSGWSSRGRGIGGRAT